jgi:hypothetical protein
VNSVLATAQLCALVETGWIVVPGQAGRAMLDGIDRDVGRLVGLSTATRVAVLCGS